MGKCTVVALDNGLTSLLSTACIARKGAGQHTAGAINEALCIPISAIAGGA